MVGCAEVLLYPEHLTEFFKEFYHKPNILIRYYLFRDSIVGEDPLGIKFGDALCIYCFLAKYKDGHFREALVHDCEDGIESTAIWEFNNEIQCDSFKWEHVGCGSDWIDQCFG